MTRPSTVALCGSSSWVSHLCGESDTVSDEAPPPRVKDQDRPGVCTITSRSGMMVLGITRCEPSTGVMTGEARTVSSQLENNKGPRTDRYVDVRFIEDLATT